MKTTPTYWKFPTSRSYYTMTAITCWKAQAVSKQLQHQPTLWKPDNSSCWKIWKEMYISNIWSHCIWCTWYVVTTNFKFVIISHWKARTGRFVAYIERVILRYNSVKYLHGFTYRCCAGYSFKCWQCWFNFVSSECFIKLDCFCCQSFPSFEAVLHLVRSLRISLSHAAPISWSRIFDANAARMPATTVPEQKVLKSSHKSYL